MIAALEQEVASDEAQRERFSARAADSTSGDAPRTRVTRNNPAWNPLPASGRIVFSTVASL